MVEPGVPEATTILVVDDDASVREFLAKAFGGQGCHVLTACDGQAAASLASQQSIDVVVLDLKMPGWTGQQTLRRLLDVHPDLVIIVLTGYGRTESAREAMRLGAYDYVTKPFDFAFLEEVVADSLHQKRKAAGDARPEPPHTQR